MKTVKLNQILSIQHNDNGEIKYSVESAFCFYFKTVFMYNYWKEYVQLLERILLENNTLIHGISSIKILKTSIKIKIFPVTGKVSILQQQIFI